MIAPGDTLNGFDSCTSLSISNPLIDTSCEFASSFTGFPLLPPFVCLAFLLALVALDGLAKSTSVITSSDRF